MRATRVVTYSVALGYLGSVGIEVGIGAGVLPDDHMDHSPPVAVPMATSTNTSVMAVTYVNSVTGDQIEVLQTGNPLFVARMNRRHTERA